MESAKHWELPGEELGTGTRRSENHLNGGIDCISSFVPHSNWGSKRTKFDDLLGEKRSKNMLLKTLQHMSGRPPLIVYEQNTSQKASRGIYLQRPQRLYHTIESERTVNRQAFTELIDQLLYIGLKWRAYWHLLSDVERGDNLNWQWSGVEPRASKEGDWPCPFHNLGDCVERECYRPHSKILLILDRGEERRCLTVGALFYEGEARISFYLCLADGIDY
ncbi:tryptophan synthase beta chain [Striga asiatica]|uniref:Tryptophan synthase beta chain n=1 Tax=Striga asiatica TaxID=4170 RepID=A0A5A7Q1R9_STRAF|nr:tryptophan synthase beta chain [Striga asiatica]